MHNHNKETSLDNELQKKLIALIQQIPDSLQENESKLKKREFAQLKIKVQELAGLSKKGIISSEAFTHFDETVNESKNSYFYYLVGCVYAFLGQVFENKQFLKKAKKMLKCAIKNGCISAFNRLGILFEQIKPKKLDKALKCYTRAITANKKFARALFNRADLLSYNFQAFRRALSDCKCVIKYTRDVQLNYRAFVLSGRIHEQLNDKVNAGKMYTKALQLSNNGEINYKDMAIVFFERGVLYFEDRQFLQAFKDYKQVVTLSAKNIANIENECIDTASIFHVWEIFQRSISLQQKCLQQDSACHHGCSLEEFKKWHDEIFPELSFLDAECFLRFNKIHKKQLCYKDVSRVQIFLDIVKLKLIINDIDYFSSCMSYIKLLLQNIILEYLGASLQGLVNNNEFDLSKLDYFAVNFIMQLREKKIIFEKSFENELLGVANKFPKYQIKLNLDNWLEKLVDQAELQICVQEIPGFLSANENNLHKDHFSQLNNIFEDPEFFTVNDVIGGRGGENLCKAITGQNEQNSYLHYLVGVIFACMKKTKVAKKEFSVAIEYGCVSAYYGMGVLFYNEENFDEALKYFNKAIEHNAKFVDALFCRAKSQYKLKKFRFVIEDCDEIIAINNKYFKAYIFKGNACKSLGKKKQALDNFMHVIENTDEIELKVVAWLNCGWVYYENDDFVSAFVYYLEAKKINSEDPRIHAKINNLLKNHGWVIFQHYITVQRNILSRLDSYQAAANEKLKRLEYECNEYFPLLSFLSAACFLRFKEIAENKFPFGKPDQCEKTLLDCYNLWLLIKHGNLFVKLKPHLNNIKPLLPKIIQEYFPVDLRGLEVNGKFRLRVLEIFIANFIAKIKKCNKQGYFSAICANISKGVKSVDFERRDFNDVVGVNKWLLSMGKRKTSVKTETEEERIKRLALMEDLFAEEKKLNDVKVRKKGTGKGTGKKKRKKKRQKKPTAVTKKQTSSNEPTAKPKIVKKHVGKIENKVELAEKRSKSLEEEKKNRWKKFKLQLHSDQNFFFKKPTKGQKSQFKDAVLRNDAHKVINFMRNYELDKDLICFILINCDEQHVGYRFLACHSPGAVNELISCSKAELEDLTKLAQNAKKKHFPVNKYFNQTKEYHKVTGYHTL